MHGRIHVSAAHKTGVLTSGLRNIRPTLLEAYYESARNNTMPVCARILTGNVHMNTSVHIEHLSRALDV